MPVSKEQINEWRKRLKEHKTDDEEAKRLCDGLTEIRDDVDVVAVVISKRKKSKKDRG